MTSRLVRFIERRALSTKRTFASIAEDIGVDPGTVRRLCLDHIARLDHSVQFETPEVMGIDELHVLHQARGIITNIAARTIIELLPDRKQQSVLQYLRRLRFPDQVRAVCIVISDDGVPSFLASGDAGCVARAQGFPILKSSSVKWRFYAGPHLFEEVFRYLSGVGEGL